MSSQDFNIYGVDISQTGKIVNFSIPLILLNMFGGGLSWFIAMTWSNTFQSALDNYKAKEEAKGKKINILWLNIILAVMATLFSIAILYLMIQVYKRFQQIPSLPT
jgi:uncharacterized membrane protein